MVASGSGFVRATYHRARPSRGAHRGTWTVALVPAGVRGRHDRACPAWLTGLTVQGRGRGQSLGQCGQGALGDSRPSPRSAASS